ncbi:MAG: CRISPR-associated endonuclease Cas1 [Gammaproteobacteria bacterium]|nr:CRISPR-associated endonuclease Cas1 [Gammaproteobacteria bacterium]MDE0158221.1 CRISPR-associated endonuclease Cas1 [Gammaproteobacteria bacterium]
MEIIPEQPIQQELSLPFPEFDSDMPLLPARMVNEFEYCPRLAYLEWVQGEWADSFDTVQGKYQHRRVDKPGGKLPEPEDTEEEQTFHARSITLSSTKLGVIAKLDLVEGEGNQVKPVDYKKGKRPHVARGAYSPERVQLCLQGILLEEHGYQCDEGILYYAESKERVRVVFDDELKAQTLSAVSGLRLIAAGGQMPPPLEDSPKCPRCSLVSICLPDEVNFLKHAQTPPRPLSVARDDALPVYVQANQAKVAKVGETLEISVEDKKVRKARLAEISQLALMGNVYLTTPSLHELMRRGIPITWHSYGGWFLGHTVGTGHKNVELRIAQFKASFDEQVCLSLSKGLVRAKILNCHTIMRRNWKRGERPGNLSALFRRDAERARRVSSMPELLGVEGNAASRYFSAFQNLLAERKDPDDFTFQFHKRNRRPPTDPVNALLSYAYSLLTRTWTVTLSAVGFDVYCGFFHQPRYGRPALSLDMMEPFRPLVADSTVLMAINNGEVSPDDFKYAAGSVNLTPDGRKRFISAYERRLSQEITHPLFGYKISYRRLFEVQARLLGRFLLGELIEFPQFTTR